MAWLQRGTFVRPSAALGAAIVIMAAAVWGAYRWEAASGRWLTRVIEYHESQYEINRKQWQYDLDNAKDQMGRTRSHFDRLKRLSDDPSNRPENPQYVRAKTWEDMKNESRNLVEVIDSAGDQLRDASLHEEITRYHSHMKFYYERFQKDRVAWLPTLPEELEVERKLVEIHLRQRYDGGSLRDDSEAAGLLKRYESEPPPHLARQAPMP